MSSNLISVLCNSNDESLLHIFTTRSYTKSLWFDLFGIREDSWTSCQQPCDILLLLLTWFNDVSLTKANFFNYGFVPYG